MSRALNEGREVKPGDTLTLAAMPVEQPARSTKAGRLNPATRGQDTGISNRPRTLNEGREVKPGDTDIDIPASAARSAAQRRPGG